MCKYFHIFAQAMRLRGQVDSGTRLSYFYRARNKLSINNDKNKRTSHSKYKMRVNEIYRRDIMKIILLLFFNAAFYTQFCRYFSQIYIEKICAVFSERDQLKSAKFLMKLENRYLGTCTFAVISYYSSH